LKIDPGARTTGLAILREDNLGGTLLWFGEVQHKPGIKDRLDTRRAVRRSRRQRKTRYRPKRFHNRKRQAKWLPPSLEARVQQIIQAVHKLRQWLPLSALSTEHAKFDTQLLHNPQIHGVEYQHGTLYGTEVKEYLLEKYQRICVYCGGASKDPILHVEHVIPKKPRYGPKGTDRIANLVIACRRCNNEKGNTQPQEWYEQLETSPRQLDQIRAQRLPTILRQLKQPLRAAALMNATRWKLYELLQTMGLPVECGTGARTKFQRRARGFPKTHYYDAACVGASTPLEIQLATSYVAQWVAIGRGHRQMARINKYGFPIAHRQRQKRYFGFQTGDLVRAVVPKGKYQGTWKGRVAVRASGYFDVKDGTGKRLCQGIRWSYLQLVQRHNGWYYSQTPVANPQSFPE
jgi:5-methylcytosine-specific restriction endonuclease McrA